jgi:hypothetical protein
MGDLEFAAFLSVQDKAALYTHQKKLDLVRTQKNYKKYKHLIFYRIN